MRRELDAVGEKLGEGRQTIRERSDCVSEYYVLCYFLISLLSSVPPLLLYRTDG